jgi:hypothetical protein
VWPSFQFRGKSSEARGEGRRSQPGPRDREGRSGHCGPRRRSPPSPRAARSAGPSFSPHKSSFADDASRYWKTKCGQHVVSG